MLEKKQVRRAFSRRAGQYENEAGLQKEIACELVRRLFSSPAAGTLFSSSRGRILEVGIGTAYLSACLRRRPLLSPIFGCDLAFGMLEVAGRKGLPQLYLAAADAENLPYRDNSFNLLVSSLTYQWIERLEQAMAEAYRVLEPGGALFFASLGPATLRELRESFSCAHRQLKGSAPEYLQEFHSPAYLARVLRRSGLRRVELSSRLYCRNYPSARELLRTLRRIGAGNARSERPRGLFPPRLLERMEQIYRRRHPHPWGGISASYEIIWAEAFK